MKFTLPMLRDFVETNLTEEQVGDLLTMTGFELEEIIEVDGEKVLDINIMANRGDGASVLGMAREVLTKDPDAKPTPLYRQLIDREQKDGPIATNASQLASVEIQTESCRRFAFRIFENVINGESPAWLKDRLTKIGQRPISLLVDLTNYVMMETGQPLHAYDLDKLAGPRIIVRQAKPGEKITTLDSEERTLTADNMMICDESGPVGVAGVMGGLDTEVSASTTRCLLEAANFVNTSVRKTRKQLGLHTEASYRFERHVDPEMVVAALERFAELYAQCGGPASVPGVVDLYPHKPQQQAVTVDLHRANELLGMQVPADEAQGILTRLGFELQSADQGVLTVAPPTWRIDVLREEDLVEEIGRIYGYDKIPEALPIGSTPVGGVHGFHLLVDTARQALVRAGFDQIISYSMRDLHPLDAPGDRVRVQNPHSPEIALLRNSLLTSLADAAVRNGSQNLHLFEIGRVHTQRGEKTSLALLTTGTFEDPSWLPADPTKADFYSLKGTVESLAHALRVSVAFDKPATPDHRLHPTRQATVVLDGKPVGPMGQIHPLVAEAADLQPETFLADLDLQALETVRVEDITFRTVSRNPATRRDIAILVSKDLPFAKIDQAIRDAAGEELEKHWLFDVYSGKGIPEGHHSLAIAMQFRKVGSNYTDEEANALRDQVVAALESLGAQLR